MNQQTKPEWAMSNRERINVERVAQGLPPKRRKWPYVVAAVLVIGGGFAAYMAQQGRLGPVAVENMSEPTPARGMVMQLTPREIVEIAPVRLQETLRVTGTLAPQHQVQIAAEVSGKVQEIHVRPGDSVQTGQLLVRLDVEALELQLAQQRNTAEATRAQLALAEQQLERTSSLADRGLTSTAVLEQGSATVEQLRSSLAAQQSMVESAEYSLSHAEIHAPFDGVVSARMVEPGQFVGAGAPLLDVVDLASLEFLAAAPINAAPRVAVGQPVAITIDGQGERIFDGVVERINPMAREGSRSLPVYIGLENTEGVLRGGMFATGRIIFRSVDNVFAIAPSALREDVEGQFVLRLDGDQLVRRPVQVGEYWNGSDMFEITEGLSQGDRIVSAALVQLNAGDTFEIVEQ